MPKFPEGPEATSMPRLDLGRDIVQQQKSQQVKEKAESRESLCPLPVWDSANVPWHRMPCANTGGLWQSEEVVWHI